MATILKSDQPSKPQPSGGTAGLVGFNLEDLAAVGLRRLEEVQQRAAAIIADAEAEAVRIRQQAHADGLAEGLAKAEQDVEKRIKDEVQQELREQLPLYDKLLEGLCAQQSDFLQQFSDVLVSTTLATAERIVVGRLEREAEILLRWAEQALDAAKTSRQLIVAVHPETLATLGEELAMLLNRPGLPEDIRLEPDESVEPTGVVVRTEGGEVDMTLSQQLARLDELIRGSDGQQSDEQ